MRKNRFHFILLFLSAFFTLHAFDIKIPVHYDTLGNGLRVIIVPDTNSAVISCRLYYFVGSMYEGPGTTGLAHMYEHMMFKGTQLLGTTNYRIEKKFIDSLDVLENRIVQLQQKGIPETDSAFTIINKKAFSLLDGQRRYIKKDEIWELYLNNGGTNLNAWTGDELTAYIVTLPQNKLELFCWIEADRMQHPVLREFYSEREVVTEERKMRYENRPLNKYFERLNALFYIAHPFRNPTIGWMSDIRSFTREKLDEYVKRYYTPDNALIVLVGNVDTAGALSLIKKYFEPIPRAKKKKEEVVTREPAAIGETRFTMHENAQPRVDILYHTPGYLHTDLYALDVIETMLSGRSGRLYTRLVTEEKLCIDAGAQNEYRLHNGCFHVWAIPKTGADMKKVERALLDEINKLTKYPPSSRDMERIKNTIKMDFVSRLTSLEGLSDELAWFERLRTWRDLLDYPDKINAVVPATIPAILKTYCSPEHKTIGVLIAKNNTEQSDNSPGEKE